MTRIGIVLAALCLVAQAADPRDVLLKADIEFAKATAERGFDGFMSYFAADADILVAGVGVISGKEAIRAHHAKSFSRPGFALSWKPVKAEIARSGDLGYTFGPWESVLKDAEGKTLTRRGNYCTVWKKQPDGSWKVVLDLGN